MVVPSKILAIGALGVVAVALVGMVVGFGHPAAGWQPATEVPGDRLSAALPAAHYRDMNGKIRGPNREYTSRLATLVGHGPALMDAVNFDPKLRAEAVARRAARRAYSGAPPSIPHPVDANDVTSCYQCHGEGKVIGPLIAPKISHQRYTNCTQCHAPVVTETPGGSQGLEVKNEFVGVVSSGRGSRAYIGAPPTIPHATSMREDCTSCHGTLGLTGLRSSHPWRVNCTQCHAPSAVLEQARFDDPSPPPWAGETTGQTTGK
jgi:nitrate reductase (cytochrome), electron transfer subunit